MLSQNPKVKALPSKAFTFGLLKFTSLTRTDVKLPAISVCNLVDGEYQFSMFCDDQRIISQAFPELNLIANQFFQAGNVI